MALNVRIDAEAHARLVEVARAQHIPLTEALSRAIAAYRREQLIAQMSADYAAMRADPHEWAAEQAERAAWEPTAGDGLEDEPAYPLTKAPRKKASSKQRRSRPTRARGRTRR
jgi:hypothetical protein